MTQILQVAQTDPVGGILSFMAIVWILGIIATIFWLWALVDALTHEPTANDKLLWFLVIFLLHFVGAIIYVAVRRGHGKGAAV